MCISHSVLFLLLLPAKRKKITSFSNTIISVKLTTWLLCLLSVWLESTALRCLTFSLLRDPFMDNVECEYRCDTEWLSHTCVVGFTSAILFFFFFMRKFRKLRIFIVGFQDTQKILAVYMSRNRTVVLQSLLCLTHLFQALLWKVSE